MAHCKTSVSAFEKVIKVLAVGDEIGLVQVASTAVARGMVVLVLTRVLVPQNEPVTEVNLAKRWSVPGTCSSTASLERSCLASLICNRTCTGEDLSLHVSVWSTSALVRHLTVPSTGCRRRGVEQVGLWGLHR